jgi:NAD(P)-dependent dehydrogenase (short-subunit alcohol dehydrogenase family)
METSGFDNGFRLRGKTALITGAAQGIGKAIATLFAEKGANLILVDLLDAVMHTANELEGRGVSILPLVGDLTRSLEVEHFVDEGVKRFGKIDILVNNAGIVLLENAETISEEWWDRTIAVNLKAPFMLAQRVAREMIKHKYGKIVNIASQASVIALDKHVAYCTSKAGIVGMTKVLAIEWAKYNINVNAISPTVILTELGKKAWAGEAGEAMKQKIPMGRFGQPEEVAAAALYLVSDASDLVTGSNLIIDGGYTIQ